MKLIRMKLIRRFRRIFLVMVMVICFAMVINNRTLAATNDNNGNYILNSEETISLYNESNEVIAYYYKIKTGGYIIINSSGTRLIEYSTDNSKVNLDKGSTYYYSGICSIYKSKGNSVIENCNTKKETNIDSVSFNITSEEEKNVAKATNVAKAVATSISGTTPISTIESGKIAYPTMKYSTNLDKRCGAVAGSIFLRYYCDHVNSIYVPLRYRTGDGNHLSNYLVNNFTGTESTYESLSRGLNIYLSSLQITSRFKTIYAKNSLSVYNQIKTYTKNNKPVIVGLAGEPTYKHHWVVSTGYSKLYNSILGYAYMINVNDGLGNTNVNVNLYYVDGCIYI